MFFGRLNATGISQKNSQRMAVGVRSATSETIYYKRMNKSTIEFNAMSATIQMQITNYC